MLKTQNLGNEALHTCSRKTKKKNFISQKKIKSVTQVTVSVMEKQVNCFGKENYSNNNWITFILEVFLERILYDKKNIILTKTSKEEHRCSQILGPIWIILNGLYIIIPCNEVWVCSAWCIFVFCVD